MEYLDLLDDIKRYAQKAENERRKLAEINTDSYGTHDACHIAVSNGKHSDRTASIAIRTVDCKRAYARYVQKYKKAKAEAVRIIQVSSNPNLMKALFWREVGNVPWKIICQKLGGEQSEEALRQAASRYVRKHRPRSIQIDLKGA